MMKQPLCLALGMGAIGKAVSGYAMTKAGVHVTYGDIVQSQIDAINRDGGYWLGTADIYTKKLTTEFISNVDAKHVDDPDLEQVAVDATYWISAVGPKGFRALLPKAMQWLKVRHESSDLPLYYMVFENDHEAMILLKEAVKETFGSCPSWLHLVKCSIERMTKVAEAPELGAIAVGETFFPIIADGAAMAGSPLAEHPDVIELVDDVQKYYFRKLLTNNLGHCVLGYTGGPKGYCNTLEAMADKEIYDLLRQTLAESGQVLCAHWGFTKEHMDKHIETLMLRFGNPALVDDLERLSRDPIRKLAPEERIVLPLRLCGQYGIEPVGLRRTIHYAMEYSNPGVDRGQELIDLRETIGKEGILKTVCEADEALIQTVMNAPANN